jgi:biopolymer transport protein ExbD
MRGFLLDVAASPDPCGDGEPIVAVAIGKHRAKLNSEPATTIVKAAQRLHEVMSYRADKVVFVKAERDVPWGEFLELVDQLMARSRCREHSHASG